MAKQLRGRIVLVQEERFRLEEASGRNVLLTLAHNANAPIRQIEQWKDEKREVRVTYEGEPELENGVAKKIAAV